MAGVCFSNRCLTDGRFQADELELISPGLTLVRRLVDAGLLEADEAGWRIHDFLVHNFSASQVRQERDAIGNRTRRRQLSERAEIAWSRLHQSFQHGMGGYRPIDFGDPILHATVTAMEGWERSTASASTAPSRSRSPSRKEFLELYKIYLRRAPEDPPAALCADTDPVFPEPQRLGDGLRSGCGPVKASAIFGRTPSTISARRLATG